MAVSTDAVRVSDVARRVARIVRGQAASDGDGVRLTRIIGQPGLQGLDPFLLLIAGRPLKEPIVRYGPFVMNSQAQIRHALEDYRSGRS
jgi:quercetin 2,3-dioxygenase